VKVRATDGAGLDPKADFAWPRAQLRPLLERERLTDGSKDHGPHVSASSRGIRPDLQDRRRRTDEPGFDAPQSWIALLVIAMVEEQTIADETLELLQ
jgi:hypothetical protein